jgi:hypothetical protein
LTRTTTISISVELAREILDGFGPGFGVELFILRTGLRSGPSRPLLNGFRPAARAGVPLLAILVAEQLAYSFWSWVRWDASPGLVLGYSVTGSCALGIASEMTENYSALRFFYQSSYVQSST